MAHSICYQVFAYPNPKGNNPLPSQCWPAINIDRVGAACKIILYFCKVHQNVWKTQKCAQHLPSSVACWGCHQYPVYLSNSSCAMNDATPADKDSSMMFDEPLLVYVRRRLSPVAILLTHTSFRWINATRSELLGQSLASIFDSIAWDLISSGIQVCWLPSSWNMKTYK